MIRDVLFCTVAPCGLWATAIGTRPSSAESAKRGIGRPLQLTDVHGRKK